MLDGKVYSAPVIRERIGGGKASISGSFTTAEAQDLAIVLRAGSLPAPVSVLEERSVGPSLGQEAIDSGVRAAVVGAAAVVVFIGFYYGLSGLIANLMLCFTMLIVMAGMGAFGATLTLPGIAGIVLTIDVYKRQGKLRAEYKSRVWPLMHTGVQNGTSAPEGDDFFILAHVVDDETK